MSSDLGNYDITKLKDLINTLENENAPLTKPKAKKVTNEDTGDIENITLPVKKPKQKREWTPARVEHLNKLKEVRRKQVEEIRNKKKLESAKILLSELEIREKQEDIKPKKQVKQEPELDQTPDDNDDNNSSSSSEEEIVIKKKSKSKKDKPVDKKKKKKTIIIESDSDDNSDNNDSDDEPPRPKKQREFKSARNKKSVIKVHGEKFNPDNFFV